MADEIKNKIINTIMDLKNLIYNNVPLILIVLAIAIVIYLTVSYNEKKRIKKLFKNLDNSYVYDEPRLTIDYCFDNSKSINNIMLNVIIDPLKNEIALDTKKEKISDFSFYKYGISSEYFVSITDSDNNNSPPGKPYKIKNIKKDKITFHQSGTKLKKEPKSNNMSTYKENLTLSFFKPSSNVNKYKHTKLADFYVSSSYRSFLPGNQILDYCNENMIYKCLYYGARYIELEIYDKDKKADTEPIVKAGFQNSGLSLNLNYIPLNKCIEKIAEVAFSKRYIYNYTDPLFLFLDIHTTNYKTLNKISDMIEQQLKRFLLDNRTYNHINMGQISLCELKEKCVIFSSHSFNNSRLDKLINSSVDRGEIKRMTYNEAMLDKDEFKGSKMNYMSNNISFKKGFNDYIQFEDPEINLFSYGLLKDDIIRIDGASIPTNNSGENIFRIHQVTKNKIVFDKSVQFRTEDVGSNIKVIAFEKETKEEPLEEYNKSNLSIVIPDDSVTGKNYNSMNIRYKGVQFVAMCFSNPDSFMIDYFNYFNKKAIIMKPKYLLEDLFIPKTPSLNSKVPKIQSSDLKLDIDYRFFDRLNNSSNDFIIIPNVDETTKIVNDNRVGRISIQNNRMSLFKIERGLNNKSGYISIRSYDNRYLCYNDSCCYLYFNKLPKEQDNEYYANKIKENASFIPLRPIKAKKGFNSLGVIKQKYINNVNTDVLYYLKTRNDYSSRERLYTKVYNNYIVKGFLINRSYSSYSPSSLISSECVAILQPKFNKTKGFFPVGDIFVDIKNLDNIEIIGDSDTNDFIVNSYQKNLKTDLFAGAVDKPIDYELIWDNKEDKNMVYNSIVKNGDTISYNISDAQELSMWRPVPNEGYTPVGVVCVKGYRKPKLDDVVCVSIDFLTESNIVEENIFSEAENIEDREIIGPSFANPLWFDKKSNLILWSNLKHNYAKPNTVINLYSEEDEEYKIIPPFSFDFKMYDFILDEQDYNDRLYLDSIVKTKEDKEDTLFRFDEQIIKIKGGGQIYDYLLKKDNINGKVVSYTKSLNGAKMCMGVPQSYWTKYYNETVDDDFVNDDDDIPNEAKKIRFESCKERDFFGTNWNFYNDKSVRLEDNNKYCLTYSKNSDGKISTDINDQNNFVYLSECDPKLKNQKFLYENNNLKVFTGTSYEPNACVTHSPEDDLRLEECGDKKLSVLWKWQNHINSVDLCSKHEAEEELKKIGTIEDCVNNSYYVVHVLINNQMSCLDESRKEGAAAESALRGCDFASEGTTTEDCETKCKAANFAQVLGPKSCSNWGYNQYTGPLSGSPELPSTGWRDANGESVDSRGAYGGGWSNVNGQWKCLPGSCWHDTAWTACQGKVGIPIDTVALCTKYCKKFTGGTEKIKHQEFCGYNQALQNYNSIKKIYPNAAIIHSGRIIKSNISVSDSDYREYILKEHTNDELILANGEIIIKAWYGDPNNPFSDEHGKDVTEIVRNTLTGLKLRASNAEWGDSKHGVRKVLIVKTKINSQYSSEGVRKMIENYAKELGTMLSGCYKCKYASKALCSEKKLVKTDETHFENDADQDELSKYCSNFKPSNDFKCDKFYRQQFIYKSKNDDFCLGLYKPVYINISNNTDFPDLNFDLKRKIPNEFIEEGKEYYPFDNLLGENYSDYYSIYLKGLITPNKDSDYKYDIVFDNNNIYKNGDRINIKNKITIPVSDTNIILDYKHSYKNIKKGDRVLLDFDIEDESNDISFKTVKKDPVASTDNTVEFKKSYIKWMGVVIDKPGKNKLRIMMSINSYEPNNKLKKSDKQRMRPFSVSNPIVIRNINEVILIKKAPSCL